MSWFSRVFDRGAPRPAPPSAPPSERVRGNRRTVPEHLTTLNFEKFLRDHPRAVVDVWAPWCGPCRAFAPLFAASARDWGEAVGFGKIHADHEPTLVTRFHVRSIPSLLFFRGGALVRTEVGVLPPDRLSRLLHRVFRDLDGARGP